MGIYVRFERYCFNVSWILYNLNYVLNCISYFRSARRPSIQLHSNFYALASILLISTLPINGFLYGIKSKTLRKTFQNYWRKKQTKSELNQEIQARTPSTCGSRRPSLTPFGFLTKPSIQRRLSETFMDRASRSPIRATNMKRIASEITWRKTSSSSLNQSPKEEYASPIKQTSSCSRLQVNIYQKSYKEYNVNNYALLPLIVIQLYLKQHNLTFEL